MDINVDSEIWREGFETTSLFIRIESSTYNLYYRLEFTARTVTGCNISQFSSFRINCFKHYILKYCGDPLSKPVISLTLQMIKKHASISSINFR